MEIALIAGDTKKELMTQFCIAYSGVLGHHNLFSTSVLGKLIHEATGLHIERFLSGTQGGIEQIASKIAYDEIDALVLFRDTNTPDPKIADTEQEIIRLCDMHNVPVATNIATAEIVIYAIERGDLDWRNYINPMSRYSRAKK